MSLSEGFNLPLGWTVNYPSVVKVRSHAHGAGGDLLLPAPAMPHHEAKQIIQHLILFDSFLHAFYFPRAAG